MSTNSPKTLETDFDNLSINTEWKTRLRSRSLTSHTANKCTKQIHSRRRKSFVLPPRICGCKKDSSTGKNVLRPARLNFVSISKRSTLVRPAKLHVKESKVFLLKPATLIVKNKHKPLKNSKFGAVSPKSLPGVPFSVGQVFSSDKLSSQSSFKSLAANEDAAEISKAFDALSFKKLRHKKSPPSEVAASANKRENTSSCSIQARMESSVLVDCDDTSIEELASYFDLFVHIPKKMSSMAEMMYI